MRHRRGVVGIGVALVLAACSPQERDWQRAVKTDTADAYESHLAKYPDGSHATEAKMRVQQKWWLEAERDNTIPAYQRYLKSHPDGVHRADAVTRIDGMRWDNAAQTNTPEAYDAYVRSCPDGAHTYTALTKKSLLQWAQKSKFEITQNADRSWNFRNLGGGPGGLLMSFNLSGGGMAFEGFAAGTLLVAGATGFSFDAEIEREGYKVMCTYSFAKGTTIQIHKEGKITPNLGFVQGGVVTASFRVVDASGKTVVSNNRRTAIENGEERSAAFEDTAKPRELPTSSGKRLDLRAMAFDTRESKGATGCE